MRTLTQLKRRAPAIFGALFALEIVVSGWQPWYFQDWAMENVLSLAVGWWLIRHHRERPFTNLSYFLLLVFGTAHEIGAHYTYSLMPYDTWSQALFGATITETFGFTRNHYDRLVHFLFGILCYLPLREVLRSRLTMRGAGSYWLPAAIIVTIATFYELLEWWALELFGGDLGQSYLGMQGDVWDAQKDIAVAVVGAIIAAICTALSGKRRKRISAEIEPVPKHEHVVYLTKVSRRSR